MSSYKVRPKSHFLILYASETGQATAISQEIADRAIQHGLKPARFCTSLIDKRFSIEKETCVVFVVSTTGDGQPPATAIKFFRRLNRNTLKVNHLANLNYALLALGDSNYLRFAAFGRQLEYRLQALSANSFYPTGFGDDAYGIETGVDPWVDNLWQALFKQLGLDFQTISFVDCYNLQNTVRSGTINKMEPVPASTKIEKSDCITDLPSLMKGIDLENCHVPKLPSPLYTVVYNKQCDSGIVFKPTEDALVLSDSAVVKASLISAKKMTIGDDVKDTLELTFQFDDEIVEYNAGDSFGFVCPNDNEEVDMLLSRLGITDVADVPSNLALHDDSTSKQKLPAHVPSSFSVRQLLLHHIEIRAVPKKILLRIFAEYTENAEEKSCLLFLSSQEGSDFFAEFIRKPSLSVLDILSHYKSCNPPVEKIIEHLPPLKPRFYSVASFSLVDRKIFRIVFNVLKIKAADGRVKDREGVCTGWFHRLSSDSLSNSTSDLNDRLSALKLEDSCKSVFIYKRKNQNFKFPDNLKTPVIMVGPGTGIAPFIGYLQYREMLLQKDLETSNAATLLFYGCRYQNRDYLYRQELEGFVDSKTLQHLFVSHSRDHCQSDANSRYVHENIKLQAQAISECIRSGGNIYVCGDAKHMVHDVQQAFFEAVRRGFDVTLSEAKKIIEGLQRDHRYVNDVWS